MARRRDYAAEYARRQQRAKDLGYQSYWHERQTRQMASQLPARTRRKFVSTAKEPPTGISPARVRALWAQGDEAMRDGDTETARQIAEQLGIAPAKDTYPPESLFWYH